MEITHNYARFISAGDCIVFNFRNCTVWKADRSPACRSVLMALDAMNLSVKEVDVNMDLDEHKSPDMIAVIKCQTHSFPAKLALTIIRLYADEMSTPNIGTVSHRYS